SAGEKQALPKPNLSVDEARMIVKDIPSVDIRAALGAWKLSEAELGQLRQWSGILVEKPGTTEFLAKWSELIRQACARTPQINESSITPLIRMVMLAAYEEAQKHQATATTSAAAEVYKQLQEQLRSNLVEARQLQTLMGSERKDPLSGSRISLPAHQRTLRKCDVVGQPKRVECKEVLVSASYELDDYISGSETQLAKAEEEAKRGGGVAESGQEKRRQTLYALSDVAKAMHDSAVTALRKPGR
ncbi:MAG: hypothetical protein ACRD2L_03555, partial [Terriglobia bacterium]